MSGGGQLAAACSGYGGGWPSIYFRSYAIQKFMCATSCQIECGTAPIRSVAVCTGTLMHANVSACAPRPFRWLV